MTLLLALLACGLDFGNSSVVTDVQIIATVIEPPEVFPQESIEVQLTIADPQGRQLEAMVWICLPADGQCLESVVPVRSWARVADVLDEHASFVFQGTPVDIDFGVDRLDTYVHALVCVKDTCPIMQAVRSAGLEPDGTLGTTLADPESLLRELPFDGTHYAVKSLPILFDRAIDRNWNPRVVPVFDRISAYEANDVIGLSYKITDANGDPATGYGFTTVGVFDAPKVAVSRSELSMLWIAPTDPADLKSGSVFVVVEDDRGGTVVWRDDLTPL